MTTTKPAPVLPPPAGELVTAVRRAVAELRTRAPGSDAGAWPRAEREAAIGELDALVTELTLYRGQVLRAHEKAGAWGSISDRDFADYRSRTTGTGRGAAMGEVQLAQDLEQLPALAEAVQEGKVHLEHAKTLTRLHRNASPEVKKALTDEGGLDQLLQQATRNQLTAPDLGKAAKAWAATIDAAAAQRDFEAVRRRRSLTMRKQAGGIAGEFFLDPLAGEELRTALEAIAGRPAAGDERTREQRTADALSTLAARTLQVGSDLVGAQVRPHLSLLVSEHTWTAISARRRALDSCPSGQRPAWPDVPPAELEDGTAITMSELERLMCDSEVTRMVMTANAIPLDVGRTQRTYTKELRRAVLTRDRHCQWPHCRLRASWCEVHHITWYSRGGHTSLPQAITLCSYHHHRVHEADTLITVLPEGFDFHHRDGTHIGTSTRPRTPGTLLPSTTAAETGQGHTAQPVAGQSAGQVTLNALGAGQGTAAATLPRAGGPPGTGRPGNGPPGTERPGNGPPGTGPPGTGPPDNGRPVARRSEASSGPTAPATAAAPTLRGREPP